ncbi:hypothetical protein WA026_007871 [Henosepilachna vigintioctopunctata]|uniref:SKP1 component POZ domain-containing protein n=1 Tax=Henosepilachna vigintioctopunctata TaxID=420089 RepID=A0AAW1U5R7_9CUCU
MPIIKLMSRDRRIFEIDSEILKCSSTILEMLKDFGVDAVLSLPNVNSVVVEKIIEWATHHRNDPLSDDDGNESENDVSSWDADFLKIDNSTLLDITVAATYLEIKGLLKLIKKPFSDLIANKSIPEMRELFEPKNEVTITSGKGEQARKKSRRS